MARRRALQSPLTVGIRRFLLDVRCARQHEIGGAGQRRQQDALTMSSVERAAVPRVDDPLHVAPSVPSQPGSST